MKAQGWAKNPWKAKEHEIVHTAFSSSRRPGQASVHRIDFATDNGLRLRISLSDEELRAMQRSIHHRAAVAEPLPKDASQEHIWDEGLALFRCLRAAIRDCKIPAEKRYEVIQAIADAWGFL